MTKFKTQIVTKLKNSIYDKTQQIKYRKNESTSSDIGHPKILGKPCNAKLKFLLYFKLLLIYFSIYLVIMHDDCVKANNAFLHSSIEGTQTGLLSEN